MLSLLFAGDESEVQDGAEPALLPPPPPLASLGNSIQEQLLTAMCSGSEEGSYLRRIDFCFTQL